ncbi:MAG: type IV pilus assembly protein PilM [Verrucomicrobiales bacterium]|nr:type IV pilus assembly protein PilM [Verrucomicrobiales bacterium]
MADNKQITVLNLGSQRLGAAVFRKAGGNLVLQKYEFVELTGDPTVDVSRLPQLKLAIEELAEKLRIAKSALWYAVAGHTVFTRFVKLPPVQGDKMDQIVEFEARQNVPFPIDEVTWDYEVVGDNLGETEVILVAMKSESLNEINDQVEANKLTTTGVDLAPIALYNSFKYTYPDVTEPVVLIDLGARSTNVVFVEGDRFFVRNVLVGGATITAAIAKEFGMPFAEAEAQKVTHGFVALGGAVEQHPDEAVAALSKVIRNSMTRLHGEVMRTINYYRSQQGGSAPTRAFLCGGGAAMGYAVDFFQEKLRLPVEIFNPLRAIQAGGGVDGASLQNDAASMGELIGLALRSSGSCPAEVELVPDSVAAVRDAARRRPALIMAGLCLLAALGVGTAWFSKAGQVVNGKLTSMEREQTELRRIAGEIGTLDAELDTLRTQSAQVEAAVNERSYWVRMLQDLNNLFKNDNIWLTLIEPMEQGKSLTSSLFGNTKDGEEDALVGTVAPGAGDNAGGYELHLSGLYRKNDNGQEVVYEYVRELAKSGLFAVDDIEKQLNELVKAEVGLEDDRYAYRFDIRLPLKQHIEFKK